MARKSVFQVTTAKPSHHDDLLGREIRYGIAMAIRTLCFIGGVVAYPSQWAWAFFAGAVILPYTSVILANAGVRQRAEGAALLRNPPGTVERASDQPNTP